MRVREDPSRREGLILAPGLYLARKHSRYLFAWIRPAAAGSRRQLVEAASPFFCVLCDLLRLFNSSASPQHLGQTQPLLTPGFWLLAPLILWPVYDERGLTS